MCRWVQGECRNLGEMDAPEVNPLLQRAAEALRERPVLFKYCAEEVTSARHSALFSRWGGWRCQCQHSSGCWNVGLSAAAAICCVRLRHVPLLLVVECRGFPSCIMSFQLGDWAVDPTSSGSSIQTAWALGAVRTALREGPFLGRMPGVTVPSPVLQSGTVSGPGAKRGVGFAFFRFVTALTRGGPGGMPRPIEVQAHDPRRYIGDMLAWVHQVRTPNMPIPCT